MKTHFKQTLHYLLLLISIGGCTLPLGNWWNSNYTNKFDEVWSPPKGMSPEQVESIRETCQEISTSQEKPNFEDLIKNYGLRKWKTVPDVVYEACLLDHGLKYHPIGVKGNYANYCSLSEVNNQFPGCRSVGIFRKLGITLFNPWIN